VTASSHHAKGGITMPTALALSGGGSRGAFELGAVRYLYGKGLRPDIICGTSAGAINGAKLAEGEGGAGQGLPSLERFWLDLRVNTDMWREEPWLNEIPAQYKSVFTTGQLPAIASPEATASAWGDLSELYKAIWMLTKGGALLEDIGKVADKLLGARALYNLGPIAEKLTGDPATGRPPGLDPAKVKAWAAGGRKLRLATVSLETGRVRYVTETGAMVEADGKTPVTMLIAACGDLERKVSALQGSVRRLQDELRHAAPGEKPALLEQIRALNADLAALKGQLEACRRSATPVPVTVGLASAVLASSSIPGIFPPVQMGGENYVDGGIRELLPIKAALDLGGDTVYAVEGSASGVKPRGSYESANVFEIVQRALVDIVIDEVGQGERAPIGGFGGRTVHLIEPSFDLYDVTDIIPGLIRVAIDYGWMRAADVVDVAADRREDARRLSDALARLRAEAFAAEVLALAPELDAAARENHLRRAGDYKRQLKPLLDERRSKGYPVPDHAERYFTHWEWHPEHPDTPFPATTIPFGYVDEVSANGAGVRVRGWTIDPNTKSPIDVHVYVDGAMTASATAGGSRPDVAAAHPGYGDAHGFDLAVPVGGGRHNVCVYAINQGEGATNPQLGCRTVLVADSRCAELRTSITRLTAQIKRLQAQLKSAAGAEKAQILADIRESQAALTRARAESTKLGCQ
jgi:NTE family protein